MAKTHIPLRIDPEHVERLDRIARALEARTDGGVEVTRSDAARAVLAAGLPIMEERLGLVPAAEKPSAKPARKGAKKTPRKA